jgi:hypothetical protein
MVVIYRWRYKMSKLASRIDLSILPDNAVKLLMDFYDFLVERYGKKKPGSRSTGDKEVDKFIFESIEVEEIVIPSREEIYDRKSLC